MKKTLILLTAILKWLKGLFEKQKVYTLDMGQKNMLKNQMYFKDKYSGKRRYTKAPKINTYEYY